MKWFVVEIDFVTRRHCPQFGNVPRIETVVNNQDVETALELLAGRSRRVLDGQNIIETLKHNVERFFVGIVLFPTMRDQGRSRQRAVDIHGEPVNVFH